MNAAMNVLLRVKGDRDFIPEEEDFSSLKYIYDQAHWLRLQSTYLECCLHQRVQGLPESFPPWEKDDSAEPE